MFTNLLIVVRTMSKIGIYALIILQCLTMVFASNANSQRKLLKDLTIQLTEEKMVLSQLFTTIEKSTGISFAYKNKEIKGSEVLLYPGEWNLEELLKEISVQKKLSFKRVNRTITVRKAAQENSLPYVLDHVSEKIQIKGQVVDESGEALIGATIEEKGTFNGTITDIDGNYFLTVEEDAILVVKFLGFLTIEEEVAGRTVIDFALKPDVQTLSEVVIVGYGTQLKENVTGAVSVVDQEFLENRPITDVQSGLVAAVPGLTVSPSDQGGRPGASGSISIRGRNTFGSNGGALIIVDGVESPGLGFVDPSVIESISVLKDVSATAIYGARASNGVLLITTKSGKKGQPTKINYTFNSGWQTPTMVPELVNSLDYMIMRNKGAENDGLPIPFSSEDLEAARNGELFNTDWASELYNNPARQLQHTLNITGASENSSYLFSLGYLDQEGINIAADDYQRYNLRLKVNSDVTNFLEIGTNVALTFRDQLSVPIDEDRDYRAVPLYPVQLADGRYVRGDGGTSPNPVLTSSNGSFDTNERIAVEAQIFGQFKILDGLTFKQNFSVRTVDISERIWRQNIEYVNLNLVGTNFRDTVAIPSTTDARRYTLRDERNTRFVHQSILKYLKSFGKHNIDFTGGFESNRQINTEFEAGRQDFLLDVIQDLDLGNLANDNIGEGGLGNASNRAGWTTASFFGRVSYNYDSKYLVESSFRYDGASRLIEDNRWDFFPSVSVGWNIHNEVFGENISFVNLLKLRASYGIAGDMFSIDNNYPGYSTVNINDGYVWPQGPEVGFVPGRVPNPALVWETGKTRNIGLDASLFKGKLDIAAEYFVTNRVNILRVPVLPDEFGFIPPFVNGPELRSQGIEIDIEHTNQIGNVTYTIGLNYFNPRNEVVGLGDSAPDLEGPQITDIGTSFNSRRGFRTDGFFRDQFDIDDYNEEYDVTTDIFPPTIGRPRIVDANGDGIIDNNDRVIIDDNIDNHRVGGRLTVSYKELTFQMIINGVLQRNIYWTGQQADLHFSGGIGSPFAAHKSSFDPDRPFETADAEFPRITSGLANYDQSDFWLKTAAFIRVRNISLTYDATRLLKKAGINVSNLTLYSSAENPFILWTNFFAKDTGWDPELGVGGVDYPLARTIAFGLNLNF